MGNNSNKGFKICCGVTTIFLIIVVVTITILAFTVYKPRDPQVEAYPNAMKNFKIGNVKQNVKLNMTIIIHNPNYGSYRFKNSTGYVYFYEAVIAEIPMKGDYFVAQHSQINVSTYADFMTEKLVNNPHFAVDFMKGRLNFTSISVIQGKVDVFKILKLQGITNTTCEFSLFTLKQHVESICKSKLKLHLFS